MKDLKQKPDEERIDISQLDGSPAPDAVSRVAMGEKPETDDEHREEYQQESVARLMGKKQPNDAVVDSIEDAYAKLFEGLAGIMRCK